MSLLVLLRSRCFIPILKGPMSCAHAQYDRENGDVFNYNLDLGVVFAKYRVFKTSLESGTTDILATISDIYTPGAYIHSFFLTQDFVVLAVWTSHFSGYGASILLHRNVLDAIAPFDPNKKVKWLVVDRRHKRGVVARFESQAAFSFHSVNAWKEPRRGMRLTYTVMWYNFRHWTFSTDITTTTLSRPVLVCTSSLERTMHPRLLALSVINSETPRRNLSKYISGLRRQQRWSSKRQALS